MNISPLGPFPVDDVTLNLIYESLGASLDENHEVVGAEFTLSRLLEFLSGYDATRSVPMIDEDGSVIEGVSEYPGQMYVKEDVIKALILEVRRLRP